MKTCVVYARYSSDNQDINSIEAQVSAINDYCARNNYTINKVYIDEAQTARSDNRPKFKEMMSDIINVKVDALICHKLDRFSRDRYDYAFYKRKLKAAKTDLIFVEQNFDDSPESIILESVLIGMAEYYSANLAKETKKGLNNIGRKCKFTGGSPPFGYDVSPEKDYIINESEAVAVKKIFEMYMEGFCRGTIIAWLNQHGYKTKKNESFGDHSLKCILKNEKYTGTYIFNKGKKDEIRIEGGIPQIIDKNIFMEVQKTMKINSRMNAKNKAKNKYLLTGLIRCGECGAPYAGNMHTNAKKVTHISYICQGKKIRKNCSNLSIARDTIEADVITFMKNEIFNKKKIDNIVDTIFDFQNKKLNSKDSELEIYQKELRSVEGKISNIVNAIADGMFHPTMKDKLADLELQKKNILSKIFVEKAKQTEEFSKDMIRNFIMKDADFEKFPFEKKKQTIRNYINQIIINKSTIEIISIVDLGNCGGVQHPLSTTIINRKNIA